jgi:hypothetical protein
MRAPPLSVIALVALLVLAGCSGNPGTGGNESSPNASSPDFPNASAIDQSVFDTHETALANTSFTLTLERIRKDRAIVRERNFTYKNLSGRFLIEPGASQYLGHTNGYFSPNSTTYSNGSTAYVLVGDNRTSVRKLTPGSVFNESSDQYLWGRWFNNGSIDPFAHAAIAATFQREGAETFKGVPVMRYEATGVEALSDSWAANASMRGEYEEFSATVLLDEDGVIRHYEYEFVWDETPINKRQRMMETFTLSDVGSTDVEKPDRLANATVGS